MREINDILNLASDFIYKSEEGSEVIFNGILLKNDSGNVVFKGKTASKQKLPTKERGLVLCGEVNATDITLLNAHFASWGSHGYGYSHITVEIHPAEIIIGRSVPKGENDSRVRKVSANIQDLNAMFSTSPLSQNIEFSCDNSTIIEYAHPEQIDAVDIDGTLSLYQTFGMAYKQDAITLPINAKIDFIFNSPATIREAVTKLASARNLFAFFANYYIPLENITFSDCESNYEEMPDCYIHFNHIDKIERPPKPFAIMTAHFADRFQSVWEKWFEFYSSKYIPTLFYEIICNRSTRINGFLNLVQSLEIYSSHYRNAEAQTLAKANGSTGNTRVPLKFRLEDIFLHLKDYFALEDAQLKLLSEAIADARNFLTHYDNPKLKQPSVQEISSAGRILRFMLLALVYETVGLDGDSISEVVKYADHGIIPRDVRVVLHTEPDAVYDSYFG